MGVWTLLTVTRRLLSLGPVFGPILCVIMAVEHWFFFILEVIYPRDDIEEVEGSWSRERFAKVCFPPHPPLKAEPVPNRNAPEKRCQLGRRQRAKCGISS